MAVAQEEKLIPIPGQREPLRFPGSMSDDEIQAIVERDVLPRLNRQLPGATIQTAPPEPTRMERAGAVGRQFAKAFTVA